MIADKSLAEKISALMLEASGALNEAAQLVVSSGCGEDEKRSLFVAIGGAMGQIGTEVLNPLYRAHPDLKPVDFMLPEDFKP